MFTQHIGCSKTILPTTLENLATVKIWTSSKYGHRQFVTSLCNNIIYYVRVHSLEEEAVLLRWLDVAASDTKYSSVKNKPTILIDIVSSDIIEYLSLVKKPNSPELFVDYTSNWWLPAVYKRSGDP